MAFIVDEEPRLLLRIDLVYHGRGAPVRGRSVLWALYPWHKVVEMQLAYCLDKTGDARKVSLGQQTLDTDGTAPLCHNNTVHNGQSEDLDSTVRLSVTRTGLACLTHRCIKPGPSRQWGDRVEGLEVDHSHRLCLVKRVKEKLSLKWGSLTR